MTGTCRGFLWYRLTVFLLWVFLLSSSFPAMGAAPDNFRWTRGDEGILGTTIVDLVIDPTATNTIYALTPANGVYKSTNAGANWAATNSGFPTSKFVSLNHLYGDHLLTMDPNDPSTLYVNMSGKVYKTSNGASTWAESNTGIDICASSVGDSIAGVAIDPQDSSHLFAGHVVSGCAGGLYESTNGGTSWTRVNAAGIGNDIWPIVIDTSDSNNLYAAPPYRSLVYSRDGGLTWTNNRPTGASAHGKEVEIHPTSTTRIFYGDNTGLYLSTDSGVTWTSKTSEVGTEVWDIAFASSSPAIGYIASEGGVFKTTNGGLTWSEIGNHSSKSPRSMAIDPTNANTVYMGSSGTGIYKSTDGGTTFANINTGLPLGITAVGISASLDPSPVYYATVTGVGFFRSTNGGKTWEQMSTSNSAVNKSRYILIDPNDSNTVYAGQEALYKSTDGGANFTSVLDPVGGQAFIVGAIDPFNSNHFIVGDGAPGYVWRTTDGGTGWATSTTLVVGSGFYNRIVFDPATSTRVYFATGAYFWKSTDSGATWTQITNGLGGADDNLVEAVAVDPTDTSRLYIGTRSVSVLVSNDYGDSWATTTYSADPSDVTGPLHVFVDSVGNAYAFSTFGWQKSTDHGATWVSQPNTGINVPSQFLNPKNVSVMDPTEDGRFFLGVFSDGIYMFDNYVPVFSPATLSVTDENGGSVVTGDYFTYSITTGNTGPARGNNTTVTFNLPSGFSYVAGSSEVSSSTVPDPTSTTTLVYDLNGVQNGESRKVSFRARFFDNASSHNATITSDEDVSGTGTNSVSVSDVTPFTISSVVVNECTGEVTWTSSELSTSQVEHRTTDTSGNVVTSFTTEADTGLSKATSHSVTVPGFGTYGNYIIFPRSRDGGANLVIGEDRAGSKVCTTAATSGGAISVSSSGGGGGSGGSNPVQISPVPVVPEQTPTPSEPQITPSPTRTVLPAFSRSFVFGARHSLVKDIQEILNSDPGTRVAETGPGSLGAETTFFGPLTQNAVERFQVRHGIVSPGDEGYGVVGPRTYGVLSSVSGSGGSGTPSSVEAIRKQIEELMRQVEELRKVLQALQ